VRQIAFEDRVSISDIIHRYFWLVDHGRADQASLFFAVAGRLTFGPGAPKPGTIQGDAIAAAMLARSKQTELTTRHIVSNIALTATGDSTIDAYSLLTLYRSSDASRDTYPTSVADIEDTFIRTDDGWRILERRILPVFNQPP
jgi:hypothetical protein